MSWCKLELLLGKINAEKWACSEQSRISAIFVTGERSTLSTWMLQSTAAVNWIDRQMFSSTLYCWNEHGKFGQTEETSSIMGICIHCLHFFVN